MQILEIATNAVRHPQAEAQRHENNKGFDRRGE